VIIGSRATAAFGVDSSFSVVRYHAVSDGVMSADTRAARTRRPWGA